MSASGNAVQREPFAGTRRPVYTSWAGAGMAVFVEACAGVAGKAVGCIRDIAFSVDAMSQSASI